MVPEKESKSEKMTSRKWKGCRARNGMEFIRQEVNLLLIVAALIFGSEMQTFGSLCATFNMALQYFKRLSLHSPVHFGESYF
jgi:hypothetical protein